MIEKPILVSHQGRNVLVHPDGSKTEVDGSPIIEKTAPHEPPKPERWHKPYG